MIKRKFAAALVGLSVAMFGAASSAQAKELVVATDTAFVPFEFKQGNTTPASTWICGRPSPRN